MKRHWPEYSIEAAGLAVFMVAACVFGVLLQHPDSPLRQAIESPSLRRALMGIAMGATAIGIVYSPWGKRSGAHINPSVTLTFFRLGRVQPVDAVFYVLFQFAGAAAGVLVAATLLGDRLAHPSVNYVVTMPGTPGRLVAFVAESAIAFGMMTLILNSNSRPRLAPLTGLFAGALVAVYIGVESPLSGMSMNPARTFGSAIVAAHWEALWIYFTAPVVGMLLAGEMHLRRKGASEFGCAKLHHQNSLPCIFCEYIESRKDRMVRREAADRFGRPPAPFDSLRKGDPDVAEHAL